MSVFWIIGLTLNAVLLGFAVWWIVKSWRQLFPKREGKDIGKNR